MFIETSAKAGYNVKQVSWLGFVIPFRAELVVLCLTEVCCYLAGQLLIFPPVPFHGSAPPVPVSLHSFVQLPGVEQQVGHSVERLFHTPYAGEIEHSS